jgi:hypothetical protein
VYRGAQHFLVELSIAQRVYCTQASGNIQDAGIHRLVRNGDNNWKVHVIYAHDGGAHDARDGVRHFGEELRPHLLRAREPAVAGLGFELQVEHCLARKVMGGKSELLSIVFVSSDERLDVERNEMASACAVVRCYSSSEMMLAFCVSTEVFRARACRSTVGVGAGAEAQVEEESGGRVFPFAAWL